MDTNCKKITVLLRDKKVLKLQKKKNGKLKNIYKENMTRFSYGGILRFETTIDKGHLWVLFEIGRKCITGKFINFREKYRVTQKRRNPICSKLHESYESDTERNFTSRI